jgi:hypothetical protein
MKPFQAGCFQSPFAHMVKKLAKKERPEVIKTRNAAGVTGFILRPTLFDDDLYFRVYLPVKDWHGGRKFVDYHIEHYDLEVTISKREFATFYSDGEHHWLDYPPRDE